MRITTDGDRRDMQEMRRAVRRTRQSEKMKATFIFLAANFLAYQALEISYRDVFVFTFGVTFKILDRFIIND
jgi:hypothetical protein